MIIPILCKVALNRFRRDVAVQRLYNQYKLYLHTETVLEAERRNTQSDRNLKIKEIHS
ncbi:MAG: hypothetical protein QNJ63_27310 [Calothrix sp. MO_192.B10]|nr:hypothetical protein [Calothrix sp. MO_192.B10]